MSSTDVSSFVFVVNSLCDNMHRISDPLTFKLLLELFFEHFNIESWPFKNLFDLKMLKYHVNFKVRSLLEFKKDSPEIEDVFLFLQKKDFYIPWMFDDQTDDEQFISQAEYESSAFFSKFIDLSRSYSENLLNDVNNDPGVSVIDENGNFLYLSKKSNEMFELRSLTKKYQVNFFDLLHPFSLNQFEESIRDFSNNSKQNEFTFKFALNNDKESHLSSKLNLTKQKRKVDNSPKCFESSFYRLELFDLDQTTKNKTSQFFLTEQKKQSKKIHKNSFSFPFGNRRKQNSAKKMRVFLIKTWKSSFDE